MKKVILIVMLLLMVFTSSFAFAVDDSTKVISDAFLLKPIGFVVMIAGTAVFLASLPIAAITDSAGHTFDVLVKQPFDYTFIRPVGEIPSTL